MKSIKDIGQFHNFFKNSRDGTFLFDVKGNYLDANAAGCKLTGYALKDIRTMSVESLVPVDMAKKVMKEFRSVLKRGGQTLEYPIKKKSSEILYVQLNIVEIDKNLFLGVKRDITAQKVSALESKVTKEISELFVSSDKKNEKFHRISALLASNFNFPIAAIELYDEDSQEMVFVGAYGFPKKIMKEPLRVPVDQTISGSVAKSGKLVFELDAQKRKEYGSQALKELKVVTFLCLPLTHQGKVHGTIALADREKRPEVKSLIPSLQTIANYLALEIWHRKTETSILEVVEDITVRKKTEKQFKNMVLKSPYPIAVTHPNGDIQSFNIKFTKLFGYTVEDVSKAEDWWVNAYPDVEYRKRVQASWEEAIRVANETGGDIESQEWDLTAKDGSVHRVLFKMVCLKDSNVIEMDDITERKKAEEERDRFFNLSRDLFCVAGNDGYFKRVNPAFESLLGYTQEELLNTPYIEFIHPEDRERTAIEVVEEFEGKDVLSFDNRYLSKDGCAIDLSWNATTVMDEGLIYAIAHDITERMQIEKTLEESEKKFKAIFDVATDGITLVNLETKRFHMGNSMFCEMLGYKPEEIKDLGIIDVHPKEDIPYVLEQFAKQARGEIKLANDIPVKRKDGSVFFTDINATPLEIAEKKYMLGIFRDITERKQTEEKLQSYNKQLNDLNENLSKRVAQEVEARMKQEKLLEYQSKMATMGEMLSAIAHQWRQPLNVIGLIVQELQDDYEYGDGEISKENVDRIVTSTMKQLNYMSNTINDFRNFFKSNKQKEPFKVIDAIHETNSLVSGLLKSSYITLEVKTDKKSKGSTITSYKNELEQVLLNIVNNAKDAILEREINHGFPDNETGRILIRLSEVKGTSIIEISDNGGGIKEELYEKIFEPYFTTKEGGNIEAGAGIGLYMSQVIIEKHMNGFLGVENTEEGAKFTIKLHLVD